jgi:hypothetical protein
MRTSTRLFRRHARLIARGDYAAAGRLYLRHRDPRFRRLARMTLFLFRRAEAAGLIRSAP